MVPKNGNIREKDKHPGHTHIVKKQRCSQRDQLQKKSFLARSQSSEFQQNKTDFDPLQAMNTLACSYVSCPSEKSTLYSPSIKAWTALSTLLSNCCNTKTISLLLLFGTIDRIALIWKEKREDSNMQVYHYHVENTVTMQMHAYINASIPNNTVLYWYVLHIWPMQLKETILRDQTDNWYPVSLKLNPSVTPGEII